MTKERILGFCGYSVVSLSQLTCSLELDLTDVRTKLLCHVTLQEFPDLLQVLLVQHFQILLLLCQAVEWDGGLGTRRETRQDVRGCDDDVLCGESVCGESSEGREEALLEGCLRERLRIQVCKDLHELVCCRHHESFDLGCLLLRLSLALNTGRQKKNIT